MHCPHLGGNYLKSCFVSREVYVPSAFEMTEYCTSNRHKICPFYCRRHAGDYPVAKAGKLAAGACQR